jgi:hypothetical protein
MAFILHAKKDVELVTSQCWKWWGSTPFALKKWTPFFDVRTERMAFIPVWVKLPGLLLDRWSFDVLKAIRNARCTFLDADMSFKMTRSLAIARILVGVDLRECPAETLVMKICNKEVEQILDYVGVSFRCSLCHQYGHLGG